jgi:hypothetical protein
MIFFLIDLTIYFIISPITRWHFNPFDSKSNTKLMKPHLKPYPYQMISSTNLKSKSNDPMVISSFFFFFNRKNPKTQLQILLKKEKEKEEKQNVKVVL